MLRKIVFVILALVLVIPMGLSTSGCDVIVPEPNVPPTPEYSLLN